MQPKDPTDRRRVYDEIGIAEIEGLTWVEISAKQARGTWDLLELISPTSLPIILPGYLKWLWEVEEADGMVSALPKFLIRALDTQPDAFTQEQLKSLCSFAVAVLRHTGHLLTDDEADAYQNAIRRLDQLAGYT